MTHKQYKTIDDFILRLVQMKAEAGQLGLLQTMHAMDKATQAVGWEFANIIKGDMK